MLCCKPPVYLPLFHTMPFCHHDSWDSADNVSGVGGRNLGEMEGVCCNPSTEYQVLAWWSRKEQQAVVLQCLVTLCLQAACPSPSLIYVCVQLVVVNTPLPCPAAACLPFPPALPSPTTHYYYCYPTPHCCSPTPLPCPQTTCITWVLYNPMTERSCSAGTFTRRGRKEYLDC